MLEQMLQILAGGAGGQFVAIPPQFRKEDGVCESDEFVVHYNLQRYLRFMPVVAYGLDLPEATDGAEDADSVRLWCKWASGYVSMLLAGGEPEQALQSHAARVLAPMPAGDALRCGTHMLVEEHIIEEAREYTAADHAIDSDDAPFRAALTYRPMIGQLQVQFSSPCCAEQTMSRLKQHRDVYVLLQRLSSGLEMIGYAVELVSHEKDRHEHPARDASSRLH